MRGIDMTAKGLIAPLHTLVELSSCKLVAIGDGGNELGMGKVYDQIVNNPKIPKWKRHCLCHKSRLLDCRKCQ